MCRFNILILFFLQIKNATGYIQDQCCHPQGDGAPLGVSSCKVVQRLPCRWRQVRSLRPLAPDAAAVAAATLSGDARRDSDPRRRRRRSQTRRRTTPATAREKILRLLLKVD